MTDEKLVNSMSEARLISASDNVIYPLIQKKISERLSLACSRFTAGEKDFISDIAYIQGLKEIEQELKDKQVQGNKAIKVLHESIKN